MKVLGKNEKDKGEVSALSVAKYLLSLDPKREYFDNKKMTNKTTLATSIRGNFRLNQMLYLLQVFYYLENKQKLFKDNLYAWENGMIIYSVYTRFWSLYHNINAKAIEDIKDQKTQKFITECFDCLKNIPDKTLQEFSYNDPAWSSTWAVSSQPEVNFVNEENLEVYKQFRSRWFRE